MYHECFSSNLHVLVTDEFFKGARVQIPLADDFSWMLRACQITSASENGVGLMGQSVNSNTVKSLSRNERLRLHLLPLGF